MSRSGIKKEKNMLMVWLRKLGMEFQTGFLVINPDEKELPIVYANKAFSDMTGYSEEEVIGKNGRFLHGEKTDKEAIEKGRNYVKSNNAGTFEIVNYHKDNTPFWNEITVQPLKIGRGKQRYTLLLQRDITARKRAEALIQLQRETYLWIDKGYMLSSLLEKFCRVIEAFFKDGTKSTVLFVDDENRFYFGAGKSMPESFQQQIAGVEAEPDIGTCGAAYHRRELVVVEDMASDPLWKDYRDLAATYDLVSSWSIPFHGNKEEPVGTFAIYFTSKTVPTDEDVEFLETLAPILSLAIKYSKQQEERLLLAYTDRTTGLYNRNYFMTELVEVLEENKEGLIAFLSVDEYAKVVDQYGHREGDLLIHEIGKRIGFANIPEDALLARFSDSTLALATLLPLNKASDFIKELTNCVAEPVNIENMEIFLSLKIGLSIITPQQQNPDELIRHADSALSNAKTRPGESISYYENEYDEYMMKDLKIANELAGAIKREEVGVHLQPKVSLKTGEILSFEALARWYSPDLGHIAPDVFIPAAEKTGKIRLLEQHIIRQVMSWLRTRQEQGLELRQIAVNISADHFFHHSFIPFLVDTAEEYGVERKWIQLEITERIGFFDIEAAHKVFKLLQSYGFTSSVDDFGTGYSSLSYLQKLPVDELKIDRSFISNMHEKETLAIVRTIIQLAENLNLLAVAEGIETEEQAQILLALGCNVGQGYFYHKPMPMGEADLL